jgi:YwiC-like protein
MTFARLAPPGVRVLPKEHGTWAMLLVPWAVGCGVARALPASELLLLIAAVSFFLAHTHLMTWRRLSIIGRSGTAQAPAERRLVIVFGVIGVAAALPLVPDLAGLGLLVLLGAALIAASLALVSQRADRALPGQILAATGLSLTAPAAYWVARGELNRAAVALWLLNVAFFLWAVFYVKLKIDARARRAPFPSARAKLACGGDAIGTTLGSVALAFVAVVLASRSPLALAAFVAPVAQTVVGIARIDRPARLKPLGFLLLGHAILFGLLTIVLA